MEELEQGQQTAAPSGAKVTVLIFSHNTVEYLRGCLDALTHSDFKEQTEVLVVDSGSTDGSGTLDEQFPDVTILRLPLHAGATKVLNIGTRTAKGEYLFLLETSVKVEPDTIRKLATRLDEDADALAVCPLLFFQGKPVSRAWALPTVESIKAQISGVQPAPAAVDTSAEVVDIGYPGRTAVMVRRQFITGMNYLDKRFGHYWADADLALQIRRANKKIRLLTAAKATLQTDIDFNAPGSDPVMQADFINGAIALAGKHYGGGVGLKIGAVFSALGGALGAPFSGAAWSRFTRVLTGDKIDAGLK
jgi:GT2 family glycosyltransferase